MFEAEGVVFSSGQTIQWLRDRLGVFGPDDDIEALARSVPDNGGVYLVPAFAGLCAPHWDRDARAAIVGLSLASGAGHVVRAGLEAMAYQTRDNVDTLVRGGVPVPELRVDGGATRNALLCQFQADILGVPVVRPNELERTALGVAYLAGSGVGRWTRARRRRARPGPSTASSNPRCPRTGAPSSTTAGAPPCATSAPPPHDKSSTASDERTPR